MPDQAGPVDALLLYNEREKVIDSVAAGLETHEVTTHLWRRDVGLGEDIERLETQRLKDARSVLVLLGKEGWGPNHLRLTDEARRLEKRIIPVLIGDPPSGALEQAGALFRDRRYADLRTMDEKSMQTLAKSILSPSGPSPGRFDAVIRVLVDESDRSRALMLENIRTSRTIDRAGLTSRLRSEIRDNYNTDSELNFAAAIRDPKRIASVRSWMLSALIWCDAEDPANRELILQHLSPKSEPDRSVRFWVLAGLYRRDASYVLRALTMTLTDPELEVRELARAIQLPSSDEIVADLRRMLSTPDFSTAWPALRILRIVPIIALVPDICAMLDSTVGGTRVAYDAIYALSNPVMAAAAAPILVKEPGIDGVVARVVEQARMAGGNTVRDFAGLLAAFEPAELDRALSEAARDPEVSETVDDLRGAALIYRRRADALFIAGYTSDTIDIADDRLDIDEDVQTLTAVMLAREITPPLAIGLFGDWGSGKSYFMKSMQAAAASMALAAKNKPHSQFCADIVQIEFNAWHYADTNLWANLVSTILEQLAAYVTPRDTPQQQQAALLEQLGTAKAAVQEAVAEKEKTQESIHAHEAELAQLQTQRKEKEVTLLKLRLPDLKKLFDDDGVLQKEVEDALHDAGAPAAVSSLSEFSQVVKQAYSLQGRGAALLVALKSRGNRTLLWAVLLLMIVLPIVVGWVVTALRWDGFVARVLSEFVVIAGGVIGIGSNAIRTVSASLRKVELAKDKVDKLVAEKRETLGPAELKAQSDIAALRTAEQQEAVKLATAATKALELEEKIRVIREEFTLARFLHDRTNSDDYRKYLGLVSTIRRDFEALEKRLEDARKGRNSDLRPVDRIVLYIDDLDRCPANKVMEVLQAVHLLLAYPLFVVVVGVDPRWLLNSLEKTYTAFQDDGKTSAPNPELWVTTARDYLEKIFQIPFSVRPMTEVGYANLMKGLFGRAAAVGGDNDSAAKPDGPPENVPGGGGPGRNPLDDNDGVARSDQPPIPPSADVLVPVPATQRKRQFVIHDEALTIKPWERVFSERLFALIPTPRAAKRFSNVYRILKAPVGREDLARFEGTAEVPGEFRVAMLLLAISMCAPVEAAELFPKLYQHALDGGDVPDVLRRMAKLNLHGRRFADLEERLRPILRADFAFPAAAYVEWLPRVSRFSFDVGRGVSPVAVQPQS